MTFTKSMFQKLAVGGAFCLALAAISTDAQTPSGSIGFMTPEGGSTGMMTVWTGCKVLFKGKVYECSIASGLTVPIAGLAQVSGTVFDMKDIGDFAGTYKAVGNPVELGAGHVTVQNEKKVRMVLGALAQDTALEVADGGMVVQLVKK